MNDIYQNAVDWFAKQMMERLVDNEDKGHWEDEANSYLIDRIGDELGELKDALVNGDSEGAIKEAADLANFAMMIADNMRKP